jgi:hypothetical protein
MPVRLAARFALCDKRDGSRRRTISSGSVTDRPQDIACRWQRSDVCLTVANSFLRWC